MSSIQAMTMGKLHKDVGQLVIQPAEDLERSEKCHLLQKGENEQFWKEREGRGHHLPDITAALRPGLTGYLDKDERDFDQFGISSRNYENENSSVTLEMLQQRHFPLQRRTSCTTSLPRADALDLTLHSRNRPRSINNILESRLITIRNIVIFV